MNRTKIEWVKNPDGSPGYTWNPITGCLNGCEYCYAHRLAHRRLRQRYLANDNVALPEGAVRTPGIGYLTDPFYPRFWPERLEELHSRNRVLSETNAPSEQRGIFVCDMSDIFGIGIPEDWTREVLNAIDLNEEYDRFYLLTKQAQNLVKWSPFPSNCYVGVSVTRDNQLAFALKYLKQIEAAVKFISFEPLLERVLTGTDDDPWLCVDWIILGCQTKPTVYPRLAWIEKVIEAADQAGIPIFLKDNLKPFLDKQPTRIVYQYGSANLRQEMPE